MKVNVSIKQWADTQNILPHTFPHSSLSLSTFIFLPSPPPSPPLLRVAPEYLISLNY